MKPGHCLVEFRDKKSSDVFWLISEALSNPSDVTRLRRALPSKLAGLLKVDENAVTIEMYFKTNPSSGAVTTGVSQRKSDFETLIKQCVADHNNLIISFEVKPKQAAPSVHAGTAAMPAKSAGSPARSSVAGQTGLPASSGHIQARVSASSVPVTSHNLQPVSHSKVGGDSAGHEATFHEQCSALLAQMRQMQVELNLLLQEFKQTSEENRKHLKGIARKTEKLETHATAVAAAQSAEHYKEPKSTEHSPCKSARACSTGQSELLHKHIYCDKCDVNIRGVRRKCILCPDYDLCRSCSSGHGEAHSRIWHSGFDCWLTFFQPTARETVEELVAEARHVRSKPPTSHQDDATTDKSGNRAQGSDDSQSEDQQPAEHVAMIRRLAKKHTDSPARDHKSTVSLDIQSGPVPDSSPLIPAEKVVLCAYLLDDGEHLQQELKRIFGVNKVGQVIVDVDFVTQAQFDLVRTAVRKGKVQSVASREALPDMTVAEGTAKRTSRELGLQTDESEPTSTATHHATAHEQSSEISPRFDRSVPSSESQAVQSLGQELNEERPDWNYEVGDQDTAWLTASWELTNTGNKIWTKDNVRIEVVYVEHSDRLPTFFLSQASGYKTCPGQKIDMSFSEKPGQSLAECGITFLRLAYLSQSSRRWQRFGPQIAAHEVLKELTAIQRENAESTDVSGDQIKVPREASNFSASDRANTSEMAQSAVDSVVGSSEQLSSSLLLTMPSAPDVPGSGIVASRLSSTPAISATPAQQVSSGGAINAWTDSDSDEESSIGEAFELVDAETESGSSRDSESQAG